MTAAQRGHAQAIDALVRGGANVDFKDEEDGYTALLLAPDSVGLWAFAAITGFSWLATVPLTTSLTADVYGLKNLGVLTGVAYAVHNLGGAIAASFSGGEVKLTCNSMIR